ncbi:hypothetical protein D9758_013723 [Tetrapyrgos nigripes]|uniref:UBA domain-containing protein n=1 Tax=Tetrapyrgos nigripes TaxID=182062 RepID=A0A8H5G1S7_9AGAR|nr:hypothetical protein D9758_013723 [Tetrapyrgos nigripes]
MKINAEPTDTIRVVKTKIKESPPPLGFAVDSQKIISSGKQQHNNGHSTVPSNALAMPTSPTNTETISSAEPGHSILVNQDNSPPTVPPNAHTLSMPRPTTNTATISSAEAGTSNSDVLIPSSVRPSSQSLAFNHAQTTPQTAPIVGVGSDGDQKVLATLEGSQVDDLEALKDLGFSEQATFEAYLLCDGNKERAASFLAENGNDSSSSSSSVFADNFKELIASLGEPDFDQIQQLEALRFPHDVALAAYLACNKNAQLAASVLVEHGADLNFGSGDEPASAISNTPLALPSTSNPEASPSSVPETLGFSATPSQRSLGKRPERPWSPDADDSASMKTKTSENSATPSSSVPSSPPTSLFAEVSPASEPMIIDDSEVEGKATINKAIRENGISSRGCDHSQFPTREGHRRSCSRITTSNPTVNLELNDHHRHSYLLQVPYQ